MTGGGYNLVTDAVVTELRGIVGAQNVLTDVERMEPYGHDEVADKHYARTPEAVVKVESAEQVARIVQLANRELIPVTPRGAGSGLSAGATPIHGGIVLSTERMNHILEIDADNMMIVVEPGVVTNDINDKLAERGLFYAGYPMSVETCFIGGNVAENAGGGKAIKYGVTERYVLGLEIVTPTGEILQLGGKRVKDVTGYNLVKLMVGSEGTLGVITKIILALVPLPKAQVDLLVLFPDAESAIAVVPKIMTMGGIIPTAVEFMDKLSVRASCEYLNEHLPYHEAGAMLLIEVDGRDEEMVRRDYETIGELCMDNHAQEVYVADNYTTRERLPAASQQESLMVGERISAFLVELVQRVSASLAYLIVKGGITSHEILASGLGVRTACVLGQILPGVPVVRVAVREGGRIPYVIFPGNVGASTDLLAVFEILEHRRRHFAQGDQP